MVENNNVELYKLKELYQAETLDSIDNQIIDGKSLSNKFISERYTIFNSSDFIYDDKNIENLITLSEENYYLIVHSIYGFHFHHELNENFFNLQFYLNEFKNKKFKNKNIKLIINKNNPSELMKLIYENIIDTNEFFFVDETKFYQGNFIFLRNKISENPQKFNLPIYKKFNLTIFDKFKIMANNKYKGYETFDKIWISRRDLKIETYWHKRFNTSILNNINISNTIINNGFKELHFPTSDLLYQIYIVNNAKIIFAEIGTSMSNLYFCNENVKWISDTDGCHTTDIECISNLNNLNLNIFYHMIYDTESKYYNLSDSFNQPYKFPNDEDFVKWFNSLIDV